jgi:hypothetical protein
MAKRFADFTSLLFAFFCELSLAMTDKTVLPFSTLVIYFREQGKSNKKSEVSKCLLLTKSKFYNFKV